MSFPLHGLSHGKSSKRFVTAAVLVLAAVACGVDTARAQISPVYIPVAQSYTIRTFQGGEVAGSLFTATSTVTYNSLGFIDLNANATNYQEYLTPDGLIGSYEVGLWDASTHALLASALVTPQSKEISDFLYSPIAPTTIVAGQSFIVGALLPANPQDAWLQNAVPIDNTNITGSGAGRYVTVTNGALAFPNQIGANSPAWAIANASTDVVPAVPEPTTGAYLMIVLSGFALLVIRRRASESAGK